MLEPDQNSVTKTLEYEMSVQNRHGTCICLAWSWAKMYSKSPTELSGSCAKTKKNAAKLGKYGGTKRALLGDIAVSDESKQGVSPCGLNRIKCAELVRWWGLS